jgi:hypothetical protein
MANLMRFSEEEMEESERVPISTKPGTYTSATFLAQTFKKN